jgi:hypothetical protein
LDDSDHEGKPREGYSTGLTFKDEFRCLVAAMFGRGHIKSKWVNHGDPKSPDIASRCAYYGKADLSAKELRDGYARDADAFALAAIYNSNIYYKRDLRKLFEEECLSGDLRHSYRQNLRSIKKRYPSIDDSDTWSDDETKHDSKTHDEVTQAKLTGLEGKLKALATQVQGLQSTLLIVAFVLGGLLLWYRH